MSIATFHHVFCDGLGCPLGVESLARGPDRSKIEVRMELYDEGWRQIRGKDYCPLCLHAKKHLLGKPRSDLALS